MLFNFAHLAGNWFNPTPAPVPSVSVRAPAAPEISQARRGPPGCVAVYFDPPKAADAFRFYMHTSAEFDGESALIKSRPMSIKCNGSPQAFNNLAGIRPLFVAVTSINKDGEEGELSKIVEVQDR